MASPSQVLRSGGQPDGPISRLIVRLGGKQRAFEFAKYVGISAGAALVDLAIFTMLMLTTVMPSPVAGGASYLLAMVLHYAVAVRFVFQPHATGKSTRRLLSEYIASGLVGVSITALVIFMVANVMGLSPFLGKLAGIGASFVAVYLLRAFVIFRPRPA